MNWTAYFLYSSPLLLSLPVIFLFVFHFFLFVFVSVLSLFLSLFIWHLLCSLLSGSHFLFNSIWSVHVNTWSFLSLRIISPFSVAHRVEVGLFYYLKKFCIFMKYLIVFYFSENTSFWLLWRDRHDSLGWTTQRAESHGWSPWGSVFIHAGFHKSSFHGPVPFPSSQCLSGWKVWKYYLQGKLL